MKRLLAVVLLVVVLMSLAAGPALADDGGQIVTGRNAVVTPDSPVYGYLVIFGGNAEIRPGGVVGGNLTVFGGNVNCAGTVNGDIFVMGGNVTLQSTAVVNGSVSTMGGQLTRMASAQVRGEVRSNWPQGFGNFDFSNFQPGQWSGAWDRWGAWDFVSGFFGKLLAVLLAVLAVVLLPSNVQRTRRAVMAAPWASLGVGFLAFIVAGVLGVLLIITICLAIVGGLLWLAVWAVGILGLAALGHELGERLLKAFGLKEPTAALAVLVGAFALMVLTYLPCCIGGLIWLAIASLGIGAAILSRLGTQDYTPASRVPAA
jgi:hypothetical protein